MYDVLSIEGMKNEMLKAVRSAEFFNPDMKYEEAVENRNEI